MDKKEERIMASVPIASSFKGILRIAHIQELNGGDDKSDDNFFNKTYYNKDWESEFNLMNISGSSNSRKFFGYSKASSAFEGKLTRYNSSDKYVDKMLPVTDSVGNFLNFYVSPDGSLFGSDETNAGTTLDVNDYNGLDVPKVYPNLTVKKLDVGIKYKSNTTNFKFSGQLNIDNNFVSNNNEIVFINNFDHTFEDSFDQVQYDGEEPSRANYKINDKNNLRTIYSFTDTTPREYDVFMHNQENFDHENYNLSKDGEKKNVDSYVNIVNLKDYVKERINKYMSEMITQLPPGSVIWQYVDLNKWYCQTGVDDYDEGSGDDYINYCGHRPAMVPSKEIKTYASIMFNNDSSMSNVGVLCKNTNKLVLPTNISEVTQNNNDYTNSLKTTQISLSTVKEIIPEYKKNFLLCDGSKYTIKTKMSSSDYHDILSFERLIDLFYVIGFEYTEVKTIKSLRNYTKNANDEYVIALDSKWDSFAEDMGSFWKDALYERAMGCILAYKLLRKDIVNGGKGTFNENGKYDYEKAKNWLRKQEIPEEYSFNTSYYGEIHEDEISYEYNDSSTSILLKLGREVKTFDDEIAYPYKGEIENREKLINTFEINKILKYFALDDAGMIKMERDYSDIVVHTFQVPNFYDEKNNVGVFAGSSAAESIFGSGGFSESSSSLNTEHLPHRHGIFAYGTSDTTIGSNPDYYPLLYKNYGQFNAFNANNAVEVPSYYIQEIDNRIGKGDEDDDSNEDAEPSEYDMSKFGYVTNPITGVKTIVKDVTAPVFEIETITPDTPIIKYFGDDEDGSGVYCITEKQDPRCLTMEPERGITSPAIFVSAGEDADIKYSWSAKNVGSTKAEFFSPECVQMLPLISL